jgi:hypothetical protein
MPQLMQQMTARKIDKRIGRAMAFVGMSSSKAIVGGAKGVS